MEVKGKLLLFGTLRAALRITSTAYEWNRFIAYVVFFFSRHTLKTDFLSLSVRLQKLKQAFHEKYKQLPVFYACAPGRVNLIGGLKQRVSV